MQDSKKEKILKKYYREVKMEDLRRAFFDKLSSVPPTMEYVRNLILDVKLFFRMLSDPNFDLREETRRDFVAVLLYFIESKDAIPDWIPMLGLWDDYKLARYVKQKHRQEIERYFAQVRHFVANYF
ncbi:YkvA family protein [Hydrogenobacter thermophilus]|uniref:YkvA family protein n=1 Tax=Hydrogenobacter thermophilus TaxID=940 RepID=UPI0030F96DB0